MDYKEFLSHFSRVACVMSVDLNGYGDSKYLIVDANDAYKRTVVDNIDDFVSGVPYTRYIPKAANFEALCDSCVTSDRPIHTYFDIELYNAWMEVFLTPLSSDDPEKGMLLFSYEMNPKADIEKLSDISSETAVNVIRTCLNFRENDNFQEAMDMVITDIRKQCGAERCCVLLTDFENRKYSVLGEDFDPLVAPAADWTDRPAYLHEILDEDFYKVIETWPILMNKSNCFIITNDHDMEEAHKIAPDWIDSLREFDVKSIVIFPLRSDNKTIGYIWAVNFDSSRTLRIKETLNLTAFILSAEVANAQNIRKMEIMSSTDLLTGVYNRNAMNNRINDDISGECEIATPFGILFIDVNGLKTINDTKGHRAGDDLLKDVASTLSEIGGDGIEIYRVGGDEFMIIATEMPIEDFDEMVKLLGEKTERPGRAHFAVGACHSDEIPDILKAMQKADARMYENKAEYYSRHPEFEWHGKNIL